MSHKSHSHKGAVPDSVLPPSNSQTGPAFQRLCQGTCGLPIPAIRLAAQPNALLCVACLEAAGDVPRLKRFDETTGDGDQVQTLFTKDRRIERQMNHLNKSPVADQAMFDIAVGDDVHLGREDDEIIDGGRSLSTVFEDETPSSIKQHAQIGYLYDKPELSSAEKQRLGHFIKKAA